MAPGAAEDGRAVGGVPVLETERVLLRGWSETDLAPLARINADAEVMAHLGPLMTRAQSDLMVGRFLQKWAEEPRFGFWAAEDKATGRLMGFVGLNRPDFAMPIGPCVEIGWRLGRAFWGRGLAHEAAAAALAHGFGRVGLPEIVAFTVPENRRSRALMVRIGMRRDEGGDFEHPMVPEGSPLRAHLLYRIARSAWEART